MSKITEGLYEDVINKILDRKIKDAEEDYYIGRETIDNEESSRILADYLTDVIKTSLDNIKDNKEEGIKKQIKLINKVVSTIVEETGNNELEDYSVEDVGEQLLSIYTKKNKIESVSKKNTNLKVIRPETSIAQSSLFTGAVKEPQMMSELKKEIITSDRIDMIVSFIKWSGLRVIIDELKEFTQKGGNLRVITTSYMGATDVRAIEELSKLENTEIKISYDTKITRLHAKSYIFYRNTGFTTAYVGSSNMSKAALTSGLEWNVKLTKKELPETIEKIEATFESYWNSKEFENYTEKDSKRLKDALISEKRNDKYLKDSENRYILDIRPYSYQQEVLDKLEAEREVRGNYKNLIVAATGVGKTCISAFDYKNYIQKNPNKTRLLFVAHREEILKQSLDTFRAILKDSNFGDLFVGKNEPKSIEHLFISIQTFNSRKFVENTDVDFYDYIIIDEFHHAAANSYKSLLNYYKPKILLGLTATPERMDGKHNELYEVFNDRIAAEIRLPEAIDRKLLCPFQYFGVSDDTDLSQIKFSRGSYDISELNNVYVFNRKKAKMRAAQIIESTRRYVTDMEDVKGLGFCVSVEHAKFMADYFSKNNIKSICLTGNTEKSIRDDAKRKLVSGEIKFIFVVDLYNEGVDIPEVNTVLFLRPTESLTVFLQQLGRGLRLSENKDCLTVLDFIGQANKKYRFAEKFNALLEDKESKISSQVEDGFTSLPKGCYIKLEKKAKEYILENIKSFIETENRIVYQIRTFEEDSGLKPSLKNFIKYNNIDICDIYKKGSFYKMSAKAGVRESFSEDNEDEIIKAFKKFMYIDSRRFIEYILDILKNNKTEKESELTKLEKKMLNMFNVTMWTKDFEDIYKSKSSSSENEIDPFYGIKRLKKSKNLCNEFIEILEYKYENIDFVDKEVELGFESPLDLHCKYTRDQILVAFDFMKPSTVREGVKYLEDKKTDILFVTLNKSDKDYSPTTMYKDYSINEILFHWQSQSNTSSTSPTGKRYIGHKAMNSNIALFVREYKNNKTLKIADAYTYLGKAEFVSYQGSKPMSIIWKLDEEIPSKFIGKTSKLLIK